MSGYVIFDMDGVLINSEPIHLLLESDLFRSYGLTISAEEHYQFMGMSPANMWKLIKERCQFNQAIEELVLREKEVKQEGSFS